MKSIRIISRCSFGWLALLFVLSVIPAAGAAEDARLEARINGLAQSLIDEAKVVGLAIGDFMESLP
jgi:hypothetical protein